MSEGEGATIEYTTEAGNRRRLRLERRRPGGWDRHVEEYSGGEWRPVGHEIVSDVDIQVDAGVEVIGA